MRFASLLRWAPLALLLAAVVATLPDARQAMRPDNSLAIWFSEGDSALAAYYDFQERFGNDEVVAVGYRVETGILDPDDLERMRRLIPRLEAIDGVRRVYGLTNVRDFVRSGDTVRVANPVDHLTARGYTDPDSLLPRLLDSPLIADRFLSDDGSMAMFWVEMETADDIDARRGGILSRIRTESFEVLEWGDVYFGGIGEVNEGLNYTTRQDLKFFMTGCYLVMLISLIVLFGRFALVGIGVGAIATATLLTLGVMGLAGERLNLLTVILPTLITIFGVADVVHVVNQYGGLALSSSNHHAVTRRTLRRVFMPCLLTTLTTAAGFLSFTFTDMDLLRSFGLYAALGIGLAFVSTLAWSYALLPFVSPGEYRPISVGRMRRRMVAFQKSLWDQPRRYALPAGLLALVALGLASRIVVDTYTLSYIPWDYGTVYNHKALDQFWGGYVPLEIEVLPSEGRNARDPEVIAAVSAFTDAAERRLPIRTTLGVHTLLRRGSDVIYGDDRVLRDPEALAYAFTLARRVAGDEFDRLVTPDGRILRVSLVGPMMSAATLRANLQQVGAIAEQHLGDVATFRFAGYAPIYAGVVKQVVDAQVQSLVVAFLLIFGLLLVFFGDFKLALVAMVPNVYPVLIVFGLMGFMGIPLDVASATVAAIVLGVAVDDTIHLLYHFRDQRRRHPVDRALEQTYARVGRSVVFTTLILVFGFLVLTFAGVRTVFYFGILTSAAAVAALVGDIVVLPLLLRLVYPSEVSIRQRKAEAEAA